MRLAKLTLHGFKSFPDRTDIVFDAPVTAIVGPNGCGKSNLVDAIKWVLGEQSAKSLRGGAMLDVIFNGSASRKPSGMAAVTLTFDNPADSSGRRMLPLDADTVAVTRQLYRDGTSEYLLNKQRVRLRDVRELFLDTGVGTDAYSIIEQGKVDVMLQANALERRELFEEAAGISRFKARKKEAIRKLERTEQNLELTRQRLQDNERRLRSVKIQATRARNYKQYTAELQELQLTYALADYHRLQGRVDDLAQQYDQAEADRAVAGRLLGKREQELADAELERQAVQTQQKQLEHGRLTEAAAKTQAEQRRQFARTALAELHQQIERDVQRLEELAQRSSQLADEHQHHSDQTERLTQLQAEAESRLATAQEVYRSQEHELNERRSSLEDEKAGIIGLMRRTAQLHNEISSIDAFRQNLRQTGEKLDERASKVARELDRLLTIRDEATAKHEEAKALIGAESAKLEELKDQAKTLDGRQGELTTRLAEAKESRSGLDSRRGLLQEMQDKHEGVSDPVKAVLARKASADAAGSDNGGSFQFVQGLLADMIETDVEHAGIVEAALGEFQQALVIDKLASICNGRETDNALAALAGRVTFLALDQYGAPVRRDGRDAVGYDRVIDLVRCADDIAPLAWRLLGRTLVVPNLKTARRLRGTLPGGYRFVTIEGQLLDIDGKVVAGPAPGQSATAGALTSRGLIGRRSELAVLHVRIRRLDEAIAVDQQVLSQLSDRAGHIEGVQQELRQSIFEANTVRVELASRLESVAAQIEGLSREQPVLAAETEQIHRQLHDAETKRDAQERQASQLERDSDQRSQAVAELEARIAELEQKAEVDRESVTTIRVELGKVAEQRSACEQQVRQLGIARQDVERQHGLLHEQLSHHRGRIDDLEQTISDAQQQALQAQAKLDQLEAGLGDVKRRLDVSEAQLRDGRAAVQEHRQTIEVADKEVHRLEIDRRELEVKTDAIVERAREQLDLDLVAAYQRALNGAPAEEAETTGADAEVDADADAEVDSDPDVEVDADADSPFEVDWQELEELIQTLRGKIQRLGNVNLDAIEEQDELEGAHNDLAAQVADIESARGNLIQLIDQINRDSRTRFEQTFDAIRQHFGGQDGMFRRLFGGGRADIMLQPDEQGNVDVLESGIDIIAKPPGKEPQSIRLLSGGEKTMTAVALLMSIFKARPSPFCILDEVDAALDEANVDRFNNVVRSFLAGSHFIVITHHKRTMAASDLLYGITMEERGVSKRVAVQFDQVGPHGKIDADAVAAQDRRDHQAQSETAPQDAAPVERRGTAADATTDDKPTMRTRVSDLLPVQEPAEVEAEPAPVPAESSS